MHGTGPLGTPKWKQNTNKDQLQFKLQSRWAKLYISRRVRPVSRTLAVASLQVQSMVDTQSEWGI